MDLNDRSDLLDHFHEAEASAPPTDQERADMLNAVATAGAFALLRSAGVYVPRPDDLADLNTGADL